MFRRKTDAFWLISAIVVGGLAIVVMGNLPQSGLGRPENRGAENKPLVDEGRVQFVAPLEGQEKESREKQSTGSIPTGVSVVRKFRERTRDEFPVDIVGLGYDDLESMAMAGDADAAMVLFNRMRFCRAALPPISEEEFQSYLDRMHATYEIPVLRNNEIVYAYISNPTEATIVATADAFVRRYHACNDIPMENRGRAEEWLKTAIVNGADSLSARLAFSRTLSGEERENLVLDIWREGEPLSLMELGAVKKQDFENGGDPSDLVKSAGYYAAFVQLASEAASQNSELPHLQKAYEKYRQLLDSEFAVLFPPQRQAAERFALALLDENQNCCVFPLPMGVETSAGNSQQVQK